MVANSTVGLGDHICIRIYLRLTSPVYFLTILKRKQLLETWHNFPNGNFFFISLSVTKGLKS